MSFAISLQSDAASYPEPLSRTAVPNPKKICKILSKSVMYIIEGAISTRLQHS